MTNKIASANASPIPQNPEVTAINFDDHSLNIGYAKQGETVPLDVETYGMIHDSILPEPYYMVGESGMRYYVSADHGEGVGVMLIDRTPEDKDPNKKVEWKLLNGLPPKDVTLGQPCEIPGVGLFTEPIKRVIMHHSGSGSSNYNGLPEGFRDVHVRGKENPLLKMYPKFDAVVSRAQSLGRLAQS